MPKKRKSDNKKKRVVKLTKTEVAAKKVFRAWYDAEFQEAMRACWSDSDRKLIERYMFEAIRAGMQAVLVAIGEGVEK